MNLRTWTTRLWTWIYGQQGIFLSHGQNIWMKYFYHMVKLFHPFGHISLLDGSNIFSMWMKIISTWEVKKWVESGCKFWIFQCVELTKETKGRSLGIHWGIIGTQNNSCKTSDRCNNLPIKAMNEQYLKPLRN